MSVSGEPLSSPPAPRRDSRLVDLFGVDLRSLASFRIALGLVLLLDLLERLPDLANLYTDTGVLPRDEMLRLDWAASQSFSLHLANGSLGFQAALFLLAAGAAVCLTLGWRSRWAMFVSWLLLVSLQNRNSMTLHGGDVLLRALAFWGLFLPLGAHWSLDRVLRPPPSPPPSRFVSAATVAVLLQMTFVYWFTAMLKQHPWWQTEGTAVYYALSLDQLATGLGRSLLAWPRLLELMTPVVVWVEALGPLFAFSIVATGPLRTLVVLVFVMLHLSMGLLLDLSLFPHTCMAGWLLFLPAWFWDRIPNLRARAEALGHRLGARILAARRLGPLLRRWGPPAPASLRQRPATQVLVAGLLVYVFLWNLRTLDWDRYSRIFPASASTLGRLLRIDQMWDMFSPYPLTDDGWYVIPGKLLDGTEVDLFRKGAPVSWQKPASGLYANVRWQKFMMNLWMSHNWRFRRPYGQWICRQWNGRNEGDRQLDTFQIYFVVESTPPPGQTGTLRRVWLSDHWCFDPPKQRLPVLGADL